MSDDKDKPAKPVLPDVEVDLQRDFLKYFPDGLPSKSLVMYGTLHRAPDEEHIPPLFITADLYRPLEKNPLHFDKGPADTWRDFAFMHELSHSLGEGTKFLPKLNSHPEFSQNNKFHQMSQDAEARDARIAQVAAMVGSPVDAYDIARASLRVSFAGDMTIVDRRPNTDIDATSVFRLMQSPSLASDPLMAATKVAIMRGDASPLRSKYNIEM